MLSTDELLQGGDGRTGYITLELSELGLVSKFNGDPLANANPNNLHSLCMTMSYFVERMCR